MSLGRTASPGCSGCACSDCGCSSAGGDDWSGGSSDCEGSMVSSVLFMMGLKMLNRLWIEMPWCCGWFQIFVD